MKAAGYTAAELRKAGFTAAELKNAGFTAAQLKDAGFSAKELHAAGFTAQQLKDAGFSLAQLKGAGFSAGELKNAGFTVAQLKAAGYSAKDLKEAGISAALLKDAGFSDQELQDAGFPSPSSTVAGLENANQPTTAIPSVVTNLPTIAGAPATAATEANNAKQLQEILKRQQIQVADQRSQQKLQQQTAAMLAAANQSLQGWKTSNTQVYIGGSEGEKESAGKGPAGSTADATAAGQSIPNSGNTAATKAVIKTGDVVFAVLDTSINSDEPGPILATIVTGALKGTKLIGSFNLPSNADKMVISFNTMSVPGADKTISISAYAIDPNTARTALASSANHHYLSRYGSLFAATFLEGFGNAFQSAGTTISVGGTGSTQNTTIATQGGRSVLENAVIGLATLGKSWGQVAQQQFNRPTTVEVCAGTGLGILFTQDITTL
jgi:intracellular multiplication protein IcmE